MKIALYNGSIVYLIAIINLFATYDIGTKRLKSLGYNYSYSTQSLIVAILS